MKEWTRGGWEDASPAKRRAVDDVVNALKRHKKNIRFAILKRAAELIGIRIYDHPHEGDNNTVIWHVYETRYDCELARLAAA